MNGLTYSQDVENVVLVTLDGLRWQEVFSGAEKKLMNKELGNVSEPKVLIEKFWRKNFKKRREMLLPFFWREIVKPKVRGVAQSG